MKSGPYFPLAALALDTALRATHEQRRDEDKASVIRHRKKPIIWEKAPTLTLSCSFQLSLQVFELPEFTFFFTNIPLL